MSLTAADIKDLVEEAANVVKQAVVRSIWREADDCYGIYLYREQTKSAPGLRVTLDIAVGQELSYIAFGQAESVEKSVLKARKKQNDQVVAKLRKYLLESRITDIKAVPNERILVLCFDATQPDGLEEITAPRLIIELTGKRCNLILTDEHDEIVVVHRHGRGYGDRDLVRGEVYELPPARTNVQQSKRSEYVTDEADLMPLNAAVQRQMRTLAEETLARGRVVQLRRALKKGIKRFRARLQKLEKELAQADRADEYQRHAELIKVHSTRIPRGASEFKVVDDLSDPPVERTIKLDPAKSVHDVAAGLFKKAKKMRRGRMTIEMRCGETEADLESLSALTETIEAADPEDDQALDKIEAQLKKYGCAPTQSASKSKVVQENTGPRRFTSQDNLTILVGRSNSENDKLSLQIARGNDLFFHVRGSPGSHVIVRKERDKSVPLETLLDASVLAVHFSKQRNNPGADVSYTPAKYVRKPKGAKPGLVQISNEKVLRPGRDEARLKRLLDSLEKGQE